MNYPPSFETSKKPEALFPSLNTEATTEEPEKETKKHQQDDEKRAKESARKKSEEETKKQKEAEKAAKKSEKPKDKDKDTPEAKQEQRFELIQRSWHLKELYKDKPIPHDPVILARLMVADHILALHHKIEQPEEAELTKAQLLQAFDYMGKIAENLEDPSEEAEPDVEQVCAAITQLAERALHEETDIPTIIHANDESATAPADTESATQSTPATPLSLSGAALIAFLLKARHPAAAPPRAEPTHSFTDGGGWGETTTSTPSAATRTATPSRPASQATTSTSSPAEARSAYYEAIKHERHAPSQRSAAPLAALAVATALSHTSERHYSTPVAQHSPAGSFANTRHEQVAATTHRTESPRTPLSPLSERLSSASAPASRPEAYHAPTTIQSHSYSSHELEHLSLNKLLTLAETIPVGHGQRLRRAYETGQIDKEGLVKILKSHTKNKDFLQEYKQQTARYRNLVRTSPEFLKASSAQTDTPAYDSDTPDTSVESAPKQPIPPISPAASPALQNTPSASPLAPSPLDIIKNQAESTHPRRRRLIIVAGIVFISIAVIIYLASR